MIPGTRWSGGWGSPEGHYKKEKAEARERRKEAGEKYGKGSGKFPQAIDNIGQTRDKVVRGYLMVLSSRNLSMSDLRKRTLRSSLMYGKAFLFISLVKVPCEIFKYSTTSFLDINRSLFFAIVNLYQRKTEKTKRF